MNYDFRTPKDKQFPSMVVVSVTNACSYSCTHCFYPTYVQAPDYQRKDMDMSVFETIAKELGSYPHSALRLIAWGEPLLHPKLVDFVRCARENAPSNKRSLISNGYWLSGEDSQRLMEAGLDLIEVSIDAATSESYRRIRRSPHETAFAQVNTNVETMISQRDKGGFSTRICVSYILHDTVESKDEFTLFENKWSTLADEVICRPIHSFKGSVCGLNETVTSRVPCYGLWHRCNISPWGEISVCYQDWERRYTLGDLNNPGTTIAGLWQGPYMTRLRDEQRQGIFSGMCKACRDSNPKAWTNPYECILDRCSSQENEE